MSITIQRNIELKNLTTLKIGGTARYFVAVGSTEELREALVFAQEKRVPHITLGGGSNMLIANGMINALVLKIEIKGIEWGLYSLFAKGSTPSSEEGFKSFGLRPPPFAKEKSDSVLVIVGAGESWDGLVAEAVRRGLWGIENLSGIPGTVGASPIQNIGAYGAEVKDIIEWVEVFDTATKGVRKLSNAECAFAYRDSIFKRPEGRGLIVTRVAFCLKKTGIPNFEYKDLKNYFASSDLPSSGEDGKGRGDGVFTLQQIRTAVLEIRGRKFPDLREFGTAGSFFKNPIISQEKFAELKQKFPELPGFPLGLPSSVEEGGGGSGVKIPLAWILDNICNLKGFKKGNVALFEKQPIVLVQNGRASSEEIESFAKEIGDRVKEKTRIEIEWEVQKMR